MATYINKNPSQFLLPLKPFFGNEPFARLIRETAINQWRLIILNIATNLLQAGSEALTLGVVFLLVEILAKPESKQTSLLPATVAIHLTGLELWLDQLSNVSLVLLLLGLAVLLQALQSTAKYFNQISVGYFAARCRTLVTQQIYGQIMRLSFACSGSYKIGDLNEYVSASQEAIRIHIENSGLLVTGLIYSITYLLILTRISSWLLIGVITIISLIWCLQKFLLPRIAAGSLTVTQSQVNLNARMTESFQALRLLHTSGKTESAARELHHNLVSLESALRRQSKRLSILSPVLGFLPILAVGSVATLAIYLLGGTKAGILPSLVTFVLSLQRLNANLGGMANNLNIVTDNYGKLTRINDILSDDNKEYRRIGGFQFEKLHRGIRFNSVIHKYLPSLPNVLNGVSFDISVGQTVAIVGSSGSGKSTIVDLLIGLYHPLDGEIEIDDTSLLALDLNSWQAKIGVVSQDTFLFNASIAENLAFGAGQSAATTQEIEAACVAAKAHEFIVSLPDGYNSVIGERGYRLSGGQRQRLALARAILKKPELLILDEATSALDTQTEVFVQEAIKTLEGSRTKLVIAHRLSTILDADQIIVLDNGSVAGSGTHMELMISSPIYQNLWAAQSKQNK